MASTFVNDLRLEEMATGENSGSWGTKTNTNLELIAESFSYGNEIIGNADTTITMADGASDAARSFFLKITSSTNLTTTRVITLAPNTVSKVWMIENATSGSQIITITQGSGASVNIANGQTKMIATDGGGSGAIVYDLMQDLAVPDLFVDDDLTLQSDGAVLNFGADSDINLTHAADTSLTLGGAGSTTGLLINNTATDGDPFLAFALSGTQTFTMGVDDGDGDSFKIGTTAIGTNTRLTIDSSGNTTFSGTVTANAGVVVDNITIDGNTISSTNTNGDLELTPNGVGNLKVNSDTLAVVAAEGESSAITLQADEADDNADIWRIVSNTDNTFAIQNQISGSVVSHITITPNATVANSTFAVAGGLTTGGTVTANAGVVVDEMTLDGDTLTATDTFTIDAASDITLNADGGDWLFYDGSVTLGSIQNDGSDNIIFMSNTNDKDIKFLGIDNSSTITALTLDMSDAGKATFNNAVLVSGQILAHQTNVGVFEYNSNVTKIHSYGASSGTGQIQFLTGGGGGAADSLAMTIDNSGNVGIGVTPEAWGTAFPSVLQIGAAASLTTSGGDNARLFGNVWYDGTNYKRITSGFAHQYEQTGGTHRWSYAATGAADSTISFSEAMRLDASGNLIIASTGGTLQTATAGTSNFRAGVNAGNSIASGSFYNVLIGDEAGTAITTGDENTAIGFEALTTEDTGGRNTAVGYEALTTQNYDGYGYNVAMGYSAGSAVTTGINNTFIGALAGDGTDDGASNVAVGFGALSVNCGDNNVALGTSAGALITGGYNVCLGTSAGSKIAGADINICIGGASGGEITTGTENITIGYLAGRHGVNLQTGDRNILIGSYADTTATDSSAATAIGYNVSGEGGYTTLGTGTDDIRAAHGNVTWATVSDERYKKDIVDSTAGLSFINALQPRTFKYKTLGELPETFKSYKADSTDVFKNSNTNHGFIAQEVKAAIDADSNIKDGFKLWDNREDGSQEVAEAALIPILVKAIQELSAKNDALEARIATLEG